MKKILLSVAFVVATLTGANAQEIFNVDFSSTETLTGWYSINADGDDFGWGVNTSTNATAESYGFSGGFAFSASYDSNVGPLTPDNSLITQSFEVPSEGAYLTYKVGGLNSEYYLEHYAVYAVLESDFSVVWDGLTAEPATATIQDYLDLLVTPEIEETLSTPQATAKTVDLASYSGQTIRIIFRHFDVTDQLYLLLDDVVVTEGEVPASNDSFATSTFSIYPNPAKDIINISNSAGAEINALTIVDINGRTVKQINSNVSQINISDLNAGVYFVNINSNEGSLTTKIVKQ